MQIPKREVDVDLNRSCMSCELQKMLLNIFLKIDLIFGGIRSTTWSRFLALQTTWACIYRGGSNLHLIYRELYLACDPSIPTYPNSDSRISRVVSPSPKYYDPPFPENVLRYPADFLWKSESGDEIFDEIFGEKYFVAWCKRRDVVHVSHYFAKCHNVNFVVFVNLFGLCGKFDH